MGEEKITDKTTASRAEDVDGKTDIVLQAGKKHPGVVKLQSQHKWRQ